MSREDHPFLQRLAEAGAYTPPDGPQRRQAGQAAPPAPGDPQAARYAGAALREECEEVARTPEGARNDRLNCAAFRVGQLVGAGYLDRWAADDALTEAGARCGLPKDEVARTVNSGLDAGAASPREVVLHTTDVTGDAYTLAPEEDAPENAAPATARSAPSPGPQTRATVVRLADVVPETVSWLWPSRLPAGKLVMLDGDPSLGKSTLALTFAAHVSTGKPWPDGAPCPTGDVVLLSAEDGLVACLSRLTR